MLTLSKRSVSYRESGVTRSPDEACSEEYFSSEAAKGQDGLLNSFTRYRKSEAKESPFRALGRLPIGKAKQKEDR